MRTSISVVELLAHDPRVLDVARLRWSEWGDEPGSTTLAEWAAISSSECRLSSHRSPLIPSTLVAVNVDGETVGALGLVAHDPEGLADRSPWVVGTVVRTDFRARGVGGLLMGHLEKHAGDLGVLWVATQRAAGFYARCGYLRLPSTPSVLCLDLSRPSK